jgi:hypothetical protein
MAKKVDFFAEDPGRYERFKLEFTAQGVIDDVIDVLLERHGDALKVRDGEESDLSRLVAGCCFAKAHKTFHATQRLCALGFGEDAAILLRSNVNLLINIFYILKNNEPVERCKEFIDYSVIERKHYLDTAHKEQHSQWMQEISAEQLDEMKKRGNKWKGVTIKARAASMGEGASLLHYSQGYQLYSSMEHADVMVLVGYMDHDETGLMLSSAARDDYIGLVLAHNFLVMADLLVAAINYFGIPCPELVEKLHKTYRALNQSMKDR